MHFALIFWDFFLIWKTFLFRFGQVKKLAEWFPIVYLIPVNFLIFTFERALRYVSTVLKLSSFGSNFRIDDILTALFHSSLLIVYAANQHKRKERNRIQCSFNLHLAILHGAIRFQKPLHSLCVRHGPEERSISGPAKFLQASQVASERLTKTYS